VYNLLMNHEIYDPGNNREKQEIQPDRKSEAIIESVIREIENKAEFALSKEDEKRLLEERDIPEEIIRDSFKNMHRILQGYIQTVAVDGVIDFKKYWEASDAERINKEKFRKRISPEELIEKLQREVCELRKDGFLGLSLPGKNILRVAHDDEYKPNAPDYRVSLQEALGTFSQGDKDPVYGSFMDHRRIGTHSFTHGNAILKLKPKTMKRSYFFFGDSETHAGLPEFVEKNLQDNKLVESALARRLISEHVYLAKAILDHSSELLNPSRPYQPYIEAQVKNGVSTDDIEGVIIEKDEYDFKLDQQQREELATLKTRWTLEIV